MDLDRHLITTSLERWAQAADQYWYPTEDPAVGTYSSGYIHWGIQSNWNYLAALATLADQPGVREPERWRWYAAVSAGRASITRCLSKRSA